MRETTDFLAWSSQMERECKVQEERTNKAVAETASKAEAGGEHTPCPQAPTTLVHSPLAVWCSIQSHQPLCQEGDVQ